MRKIVDQKAKKIEKIIDFIKIDENLRPFQYWPKNGHFDYLIKMEASNLWLQYVHFKKAQQNGNSLEPVGLDFLLLSKKIYLGAPWKKVLKFGRAI